MATNWNKPMQWNNAGIAPSDDLIKNGFSGGYKPPAGVFNKFFNTTQKCIEQLQKEHDDNKDTHILLSLDSFAKIGVTVGEETIEAIATNMPSNSELFVSTGSSSNQSIYPASYGIMRVTKKDITRVWFEFLQKSTGSMWIGTYDSSTEAKWTGWIKYATPDDLAKYLPLIGGTLNGALKFKTQENGKSEIYKNHTPTQDYGTYISDYDASGDRVRLILSALNEAIYFQDKAAKKSYPIYGEHNFAMLQSTLGTYLKTYTGLDQIGLSMGSETIESIATNMPSNSTLFISITSGNAAIYPSQYGVLYVMKKDTTRTFFEYYDKATYKAFRAAYDTALTDKWTGWYAYTIANIKRNPSDTSGDIIDKHFTVGVRDTRKEFGDKSAAIGDTCAASGYGSSASGVMANASGMASHAEGQETTASGTASHAEGTHTTASGTDSHAEGNYSAASGSASHAEGYTTKAIGARTHAEGEHTEAHGTGAHAEGYKAIARGNYSHAGGHCTEAAHYQAVYGKYNVLYDGASNPSSANGTAFIIGTGVSETERANGLRVTFDGKCMGSASFSASGADYAEYFEWLDGNPDNEDRRGYFVTLDGEKIRKATAEDDYILGIVSAVPVIVGNNYSDMWKGMYLKDVFGERLTQTVEVPETQDDEGVIIPAHTATRFVLNPEYDPTQKYIGRDQRKEWAAIGTHGQLVIVDDGTCEVNGYCTVADGGTATKADEKTEYRVIARLDDTHIKVFIK